MLRQLLTDQRGMVHSLDYLFLTCVIAIGGVVGVVAFRDQLAQEAVDVGTAIDVLDQSFVYVVPGEGYDPDVPFNPENPQGYKVSSYVNTSDIPANQSAIDRNQLQFQSFERLGFFAESKTVVKSKPKSDSR
ncbi:hypothetical protein AB1L42_15075 [Thalassoglobus sp. JC818]|uniref:hypothetical protein n=1 Tax=Thalassoglobus sp. JC818 TaxID=3232136 RepID=UPI00345843A0